MDTQSNKPAAKPDSQVPATSLSGMLSTDRVKARFAEIMGQRAPAFISSIISATRSNPELAKCEPDSVIASAVIAATLDLPIQNSLGFAAMVPYDQNVKTANGWEKKKLAQFQIMWRGLVQLAIRSGQYQNIHVAEVYEGELVSHNRITGEVVIDPEKRVKDGPVVGYVAYFKLLSGFEKYLYWTKKECEDHGKRYSRSFDSEKGRWKLDFDAMAKKTVLKMLLSKFGILSVTMQEAVRSDQATINPDTMEIQYVDNPDDAEYQEYKEDTAKATGQTIKAQLLKDEKAE